MEVHHHAHTSRKKWSHYFWEFLMLFLAVFCGFLAEYQLEHTIEHDREKIFIKSLVEDVAHDTSMIRNIEARTLNSLTNIDTTADIIQSGRIDNSSMVNLYRANLRSLTIANLVFTDRTSSQLKFSGGMRLIRNKRISDSIINYWSRIDRLIIMNDQIETLKMHAREKSYSIFNQKYYTNKGIGAVDVNTTSPALMTNNSMILVEYSNRLQHIRNRISNVFLPLLSEHKVIAQNLMQAIKEEYHLK